MNFSTFNLPPEIEQLITTLFAENKCACHVINPNKTRILMWKEVKNSQTTYYLRIGIQRFVSQEQIDRNGEIYWRYWSYSGEEKVKDNSVKEAKEEVSKETQKENQTETNSESPITKYQERLKKTQGINHVNDPNQG